LTSAKSPMRSSTSSREVPRFLIAGTLLGNRKFALLSQQSVPEKPSRAGIRATAISDVHTLSHSAKDNRGAPVGSEIRLLTSLCGNEDPCLKAERSQRNLAFTGFWEGCNHGQGPKDSAFAHPTRDEFVALGWILRPKATLLRGASELEHPRQIEAHGRQRPF
jgi:hypothetical protein